MNDLILTQEMFEASKVLAPAICRGKASLFFDGYGVRKYLTITGRTWAGEKPRIKITTEIDFEKAVHEFELQKYMELEWPAIKELISVLGDKPEIFANIKPFNWQDLQGKTLKIIVGEGPGMAVMGKCEETGDIYVLHAEYSREKVE